MIHHGDQEKNTEARQRKRAANQEASAKAEQGKNTEARQRKHAEIQIAHMLGTQYYQDFNSPEGKVSTKPHKDNPLSA